jgi:hypothetical protein
MAKLITLTYRASRSIDFDTAAIEATVSLDEGEKAADAHMALVKTVDSLLDEDVKLIQARHAKEKEAQEAKAAAQLPPKTVEEAEQIAISVNGKDILLKDATVSQLKSLAADASNVRLSTAAYLILGYPNPQTAATPAAEPDRIPPETPRQTSSGVHRVPDWVKMDNPAEPRDISQCTENELRFIINSNKVKREPDRWGAIASAAEAELKKRG